MTSKVIVPVSDFAALITRIEALENELTARKEREAKRYNHGPCLRCGYGPWESFRASQPKCCPRCHSAYWDQEPRNKRARMPEDPPNPLWTSGKPGPRARVAARATMPVVEAPLQSNTGLTRPPIILPPELRPPGEPLIPPPPLPDVVAARTVDNPMNVKPVTLSEQLAERVTPVAPTEHVAVMPEAIAQALLNGELVTYDDIKAAREGGDGRDADVRGIDQSSGEQSTEAYQDIREGADGGDVRPDPPALAEKKAAFFAGYEVPAGEVDAPETPFVKGTETPSLAPPPDDDPFWK